MDVPAGRAGGVPESLLLEVEVEVGVGLGRDFQEWVGLGQDRCGRVRTDQVEGGLGWVIGWVWLYVARSGIFTCVVAVGDNSPHNQPEHKHTVVKDR